MSGLTKAQKAKELRKIEKWVIKGGDIEAAIERAAKLRLDRLETMSRLMPHYKPPTSGSLLDRLEKNLNAEGAKRAAAARVAKAWQRGARNAIDNDLPLSDLDRIVAVNERAERLRIDAEAREIVQAERAATNDTGDDYADVAALIAAGIERRQPDTGGLRSDGIRLAYSAAVNGLVGPPESGKTLVAVHSACDTLKAGGRVLHVDSDHNGAEATLALYLAADGIDASLLADRNRFRYVDVRSADHLRRVVADASQWSPSFVIVDSVGEVVPLFGGDSNSNDDYRRIHREVLSPLSGSGAAVLVLDHVTKEEGRGGYAIGAGAKKAAIDGSYLAVVNVEPFVPGQGGAAALTILKDRHGGLRAASPAGKQPTASVFRLDSRGGVSTWEFYPGRPAEDREDEQAEADVDYVLALDPFPTSRPKLQAAIRAAQGTGWSNVRASQALAAARERRDAATVTFNPTTNERNTKG